MLLPTMNVISPLKPCLVELQDCGRALGAPASNRLSILVEEDEPCPTSSASPDGRSVVSETLGGPCLFAIDGSQWNLYGAGAPERRSGGSVLRSSSVGEVGRELDTTEASSSPIAHPSQVRVEDAIEGNQASIAGISWEGRLVETVMVRILLRSAQIVFGTQATFFHHVHLGGCIRGQKGAAYRPSSKETWTTG